MLSSTVGGSTVSMGARVALENEKGLISSEARYQKLFMIFDLCLMLLLSADFIGWWSGRRMPFSYARAYKPVAVCSVRRDTCL